MIGEALRLFACRLGQAQDAYRLQRYPNSDPRDAMTHLHFGRVWTRVDVGCTGKLMVNMAGEIYGIREYGKVHKGHAYGTLWTLDDWDWGGYRPERKVSK